MIVLFMSIFKNKNICSMWFASLQQRVICQKTKNLELKQFDEMIAEIVRSRTHPLKRLITY